MNLVGVIFLPHVRLWIDDILHKMVGEYLKFFSLNEF